MPAIRFNVIANFIGRGWSSIINIILVPFYIKFMGVEAYGLVGFYATMLAVFNMLDFGISKTLNRELAILSNDKKRNRDIADTTRTLEFIYWGISLFILLCVFTLAPFISKYWVNPEHMSVSNIEDAIRLMGLVIGLRFSFGLYSGGLAGLQRQVLLNSIVLILGTFRGVGTVLVLWKISPTIQAFFIFQSFAAFLETFFAMVFLWRCIPSAYFSAKFMFSIVRKVGRFAGGMAGIGVTAMLLTQVDKIVISKFVSLESFGYYNLASTVAIGLQSLLVYPVGNAVFPRLSQLMTSDPEGQLIPFYHKSCQLVSLLIIPTSLVVISFSYAVLMIWTSNPKVSQQTYLLLSLMTTGMLFNSFMNIPYVLQLASGWTKLMLYYNAVSVVIIAPVLIYVTPRFGVFGAAIIWMLLNISYNILIIPLMHRRLLKTEKTRWYLNDIGIPLITGIVAIVAVHYILQQFEFSFFLKLCIAMLTMTPIVFVSIPEGRIILKNLPKTVRKGF